MGMSTHVVGIVPPDDRWKAMKAVYDAAQAAAIAIPPEVEAFFDGEEPDPAGLRIALRVRAWTDPHPSASREGYEIDLSDIPQHVKTIRFYNSW